MKLNTIKLLLFIGVILNTLTTTSAATSGYQGAAPSNFELWLEGRVLGDQMIAILDAENSAIREYVASNNLNSVVVDFYWTSNEGDQVRKNTTSIPTASTADYSSWTYEIPEYDPINGSYTFTITENSANCSQPIPFVLGEDEVVVIDENPVIELPDFECGVEQPIETPDPSSLLQTIRIGQTLNVGGFPILMQTVVGDASVQNGLVSGTGIIPLPFSNKTVKIEMNGAQFDTEGRLINGEVLAVADNPANYPDFTVNPGVLTIGGDICLPEDQDPGYSNEECNINLMTGYSDTGFDSDGIHKNTNTPYDDNDFDKSGIHLVTGIKYNEYGCSREGYDENNAVCDPSYRLNPEAEANALLYKDELAGLIGTTLTSIKTDLNAQKDELQCDDIRGEMNTLLTTLGYTRSFIFGENDKYFNAGLHKEFTEEPKPFQITTERDEDVETLELRHIDLYKCDKVEYAILAYLASIIGLEEAQAELEAEIYSSIEKWSSYLINQHKDEAKYLVWLRKQLTNKIKDGTDLDVTYLELVQQTSDESNQRGKVNDIFKFDGLDYSHMVASSNTDIVFDDAFTIDDASFLFRQGEESIRGVDRAFYLEALSQQQMFALEGNQPNTGLLPIRIAKTVGNKTYCIFLDNLRFTKDGSTLDAYLIIEHPESGQKFVLKSTDLQFNTGGIQSASELTLLSDVELRLNNAAKLVLKGNGGTKAVWDCEGFQSLSISAAIEFCREKVTPLDPQTFKPLEDTARYRLQVDIQEMSEWLDFYIVVNAKPFALTGKEEIKWSLTNMVLDFSSTKTPEFKPLDGYASPFYVNGKMEPRWKGFFMENLEARFEEELSKGDKPIIAGANKVLIDGRGFSGEAYAENVLPIDEGNLDGWAFSIERLQLKVLNNKFAGAGFGGEIRVPIMEGELKYVATIDPNDRYKFTVQNTEKESFNLFAAEIELQKNCKIDLEYSKLDGFEATALLHGSIAPKNDEIGSTQGIQVNLPSFTFQDLSLSNKRPYLDLGKWGMTGELGVETGGFELNITKFKTIKPSDETAGARFDVNLILSGKVDLKATGGLEITGELVEENGTQKWQYADTRITKLAIDASFSGVKRIKGLVEWYGSEDDPHPVYGKGFRGNIGVKFDKIEVEVLAAAQFGKVDDYKYFFVDAMALIPGVGLSVGPVNIVGFGGGISNRMSKTNFVSNFLSLPEEDAFLPIGGSFSNTLYTPDRESGIGLQAIAMITAGSNEDTFNGTASLNFDFYNGGGLKEIAFRGAGQFLSELDLGIDPKDFKEFDEDAESDEPPKPKKPSSVNSLMSAHMALTLNWEDGFSFDGYLGTYLNTPLIRGAGTDGGLVVANLHFDRNDWWVYVGTPDSRCGLKIGIGNILNVEATSYFDVGTIVPAMPPIPDNVREIAYKIRNNSSLRSSGRGLVFGADFEIAMKLDLKLASAEVEAEAGFDVMLRQFNDVTCSNTGKELGVNGWYAGGQVYAYAGGKIKILGLTVFKAGVAAALQAALPNPTFAQATVGVRVKIGFIKIRKSLRLKIGEPCELDQLSDDQVLGADIVVAWNPEDGMQSVQTNTIPEVVLGYTLQQNYPIADINGNESNYKLTSANLKLYNKDGGLISGVSETDFDKVTLRFTPNNELPPNEEITCKVFVKVNKNDVFFKEFIEEIIFKTGSALDYIPDNNIEYQYPINDMVNFYPEEYKAKQGYIKLNYGQSVLADSGSDDFVNVVRVRSEDGEVIFPDFSYNPFNLKFTYDLDPNFFEAEKIYTVDLLNVPKQFVESGDLDQEFPEGGPTQASNLFDDPDAPANGSTLLTITFRCSKYKTADEKVSAVFSLPYQNGFSTSNAENFGVNEVGGGLSGFLSGVATDRLFGFTTSVNYNESWFTNYATIYEEYLFYLDGSSSSVPTSIDELKSELGKNNFGTNFLYPSSASAILLNDGSASVDQVLDFRLGEVASGYLSSIDFTVSLKCAFSSLFSIDLSQINFGSGFGGWYQPPPPPPPAAKPDPCDLEVQYPEVPVIMVPTGTYNVDVTYTLPGNIPSTQTRKQFRYTSNGI